MGLLMRQEASTHPWTLHGSIVSTTLSSSPPLRYLEHSPSSRKDLKGQFLKNRESTMSRITSVSFLDLIKRCRYDTYNAICSYFLILQNPSHPKKSTTIKKMLDLST